MKRPRRKFLRLAAGSVVLSVFSRGASAVDYPCGSLRISLATCRCSVLPC